ncbi:MAG: dihydroorotate dehydrogenase electron transfer subunit [Thermotogaceae bacterium]|jgi:dihydroorotate dehydrogenase electron transfer subunit|nr:dihydroorotate dehydrogenase electron transfer subunit [Thermotogaceae bacterium]MDN5337094.1 dihydroorotate dehydrogenase electron transfer subunit [Thermotogaceae bacterium]
MEKLYLKVQEKVQVNKDTWLIIFDEDFNFEPGQFIMVETPKLVRKPFVLGRWSDKSSISVQVKGEGTKWIVEESNFLKAHGPLGKPFTKQAGKGLLIASPTCLTLANVIKEIFETDVLIGSRTPLIIDIPYKTAIGNEDFMNSLKNSMGYDWYLVYGSKNMQKTVYDIFKGKKLFFSLEEYMGCGIGACKSCAIETKHGIKHVCTDGPIFAGDELCW